MLARDAHIGERNEFAARRRERFDGRAGSSDWSEEAAGEDFDEADAESEGTSRGRRGGDGGKGFVNRQRAVFEEDLRQRYIIYTLAMKISSTDEEMGSRPSLSDVEQQDLLDFRVVRIDSIGNSSSLSILDHVREETDGG